MERAVMDLPLPDSPTRPSASPRGSIESEMPSMIVSGGPPFSMTRTKVAHLEQAHRRDLSALAVRLSPSTLKATTTRMMSEPA